MALSIVKIGRQKTLASLAKAAFKLETNDAGLQAKAEAALVEANPHLANEAGIKAGTEIIVPKVPGLGAIDPSRLANKADASLHRLAAGRAKSLSVAAVAAFADAIETARRNLKELESKEIDHLLQVRPDLIKQMGALSKAAEADIEALRVRSQATEKSIKQASDDLAKLSGKTRIER
jgi:HPt (histidine-containing phosphotransfer) domain-containing protein